MAADNVAARTRTAIHDRWGTDGHDRANERLVAVDAAAFSRGGEPMKNATDYAIPLLPLRLHFLLHLALARPYADVWWTTTFWVDVYVRSSSR